MSDKQYTHHDDQTQLETALRKAQPWFEANATFLIYGLAGILAIAAGIVWYQRQPETEAGVSALFHEASAPEDYQTAADQYGDSALGPYARLSQAEGLIASGAGKLFSDREAANAELEQADAALSRLADSANLNSTIRERVLIDQARLAEIRCDGTEASQAAGVAAWQAVLDHNPSSFAKDLAEGQIEVLNTPGESTFYAWFHELDPKPADDLELPGLGSGPSSGGPMSNVPSIPGLNLPTTPTGEPAEGGSTEQPESVVNGPDQAAPGEAEPESTTDGAEDPASETDAESATPDSPEADADEQPVEPSE